MHPSVVCKKKSISVISWIRNELNLFNFIEPFSWIIQVLREIFKDNEKELDSNNERLIILFIANLKQLLLYKLIL